MATVYIGIGSNLGDRRLHIECARDAMARIDRTRVVAFSPVYETAPVGPQPQGAYLNAAARVETELGPHELLSALREIESEAGRPQGPERTKWGPRTLDLDILLFEDRVISTDDLIVPHPLMHERWFVLKPLSDLAPQAVHPLLEMTVGELLKYVQEDGDE